MSSVLIVDDEPNIRRMVGALLASEGYEVRDAAEGAVGLQRIAESCPDVVLLDLMIPGELDGLATLARLRERQIDAQVVLISGHGNIESAVRAIKMGAFDFGDARPPARARTRRAGDHDERQGRIERRREGDEARRVQLPREAALAGRSAARARVGARASPSAT